MALNVAQQCFVKIMGSTFDDATRRINEAFDSGNIGDLQSLASMYLRWTKGSGNANFWIIVAEYAAAALHVACYPQGVHADCADCGDPTPWKGDSTTVCPECGDAREFQHGTGKYYDAFA